MEFLLRLDTLGIVEMRYLRGRERYRDWPPFLLIAASRQAQIRAYLTREVAEQLHQQILAVEEATGLGMEDDEDEDDEDSEGDELEGTQQEEAGSSTFSPAFAQALEKLNDLARQRLPEGSVGTQPGSEELPNEAVLSDEEEDALEQLQDAFIQMMEVVRELAEELSTDALKLMGRFRCARTDIFFTPQTDSAGEVEDEEEEGVIGEEEEIELALILRLFEEGRAKPDDMPVAELQLDVDDFERLHGTLDLALERDRRSSRRRRQ